MLRFLSSELWRLHNTATWSWNGWIAAWATEKSLRQWTVAQTISVTLALVVHMSSGERALIVALGFLVLAAELANTAIETIVNRVSPERSDMARKAKDVGSAMVMFTAISVVSAWLVVLAA